MSSEEEEGIVIPPPFIWDPQSSFPTSQDGDNEIYDDDDDADDEDDHHDVDAWQMDVSKNTKNSSMKLSPSSRGMVVVAAVSTETSSSTTTTTTQLVPTLSSGGTDMTPSPEERHRRRRFVRSAACNNNNNSPSWSDASVRTQLWDAFRLTRVILGEPSRRLTNHTILHAIQQVAEMKLQIVHLQDLVDRYQQQQLEQYERQDVQLQQRLHGQLQDRWDTELTMVRSTSPPLPLLESQLTEEEEEDDEKEVVEPEQIGSDHVVDVADSSAILLKQQQQEHEESMQALQLELNTVMEQLYQLRSLQEQQLLHEQQQQHQKGRDETTTMMSSPPPPPSVSSSAATSRTIVKDSDDGIDVLPLSPVIPSSSSSSSHGDGNSTSIGINYDVEDMAEVKRNAVPDDSQQRAWDAELYDRQEHRRQLERQQQEQHQEIEQLLQHLTGRLEETSALSAAKVQALHDQLADAQSRQDDLHRQQLQDLRDELQMKDRCHEDQVVTLQTQHDRTIKQLQIQVQSYQAEPEQQQQSSDMQSSVPSTERRLDLTEDVDPSSVERLLQRVYDLNQKQRQKQLYRNDFPSQARSTGTTMSDDDDDEINASEVHQQVVHLLSRMVRTKPVPQQQEGPTVDLKKKFDDLKQKWTTARQQRMVTEDNYCFLQLQKELLSEDMVSTRPAEDWTEMLVDEKEKFEQELNDMLALEQRRVEEIEALDKELDHLASALVHCEDLEREFLEQQRKHKTEVQEVRLQSKVTIQRLEKLRSEVEESISKAADRGQASDLAVSEGQSDIVWSAEELRIRLLERALARRDNDLLEARAELTLMQERIQALETFNSTKGRQPRGNGATPVDYDTDSTATAGSTRSLRVGSNKSVRLGRK